MATRAFVQFILAIGLLVPGPAALAQSLDLTIDNYGVSIGDSRIVYGIRLNFRDRNMERVKGINATIWTPYKDARGGEVEGLALGIPLTGARRITGAAIGILGAAADEEFTGLGVGGFGLGAGGNARGIMIGGFGVGAGGNVRGLTVGGFGAGAGGDILGITIGGFGAGAGGDIAGFTFGGFGAGAGGSIKGITVGGFGAGAGADLRGITIGGIGAGAGGELRGLAIAGVMVGAPDVRGIVISGIMAGGHDVRAGVLAPIYFRLQSDDDGPMGVMRGVSVSSFNHMKGDQRGLAIGLLNYAWELNGVQIGLLNYARNNRPGLRLLPIFNKNWS